MTAFEERPNPSMLKVLFVANTSWFLYNFRLSFAQELRDQGAEVVLCAPRDRFTALLEQAGFRWLELRLGRQTLLPWQEIASISQLVRIYRREAPDLVHHLTIKPVIYGTLAARWAGVPAVVNGITGRGYAFLGKGIRARLLQPVATMLYRLAFAHPNHAAVFENEVDRADFLERRLIHARRAHLIEGAGVDTDQFHPPDDEGTPSETPLVVMPARMLWDKGAGVVVEAARKLKPRLSLRVALVGEPDPGNPASIDRSILEAWHAEGAVEWWGWQEDMAAIYRQCDIVTLPTTYGEGVPTALMEAAASGRPIVASDSPGCRAVVIPGRTGLLVPPDDPDALAEALETLARDPDMRAAMGKAARALALQRFTRDKVNAERLTVYRQVLPPDQAPE